MSKPWDILRQPGPIGTGTFQLPLRVQVHSFNNGIALIQLGRPENSILGIDSGLARLLSEFFAELADQLGG